jgi:hypothetical protein
MSWKSDHEMASRAEAVIRYGVAQVGLGDRTHAPVGIDPAPGRMVVNTFETTKRLIENQTFFSMTDPFAAFRQRCGFFVGLEVLPIFSLAKRRDRRRSGGAPMAIFQRISVPFLCVGVLAVVAACASGGDSREPGGTGGKGGSVGGGGNGGGSLPVGGNAGTTYAGGSGGSDASGAGGGGGGDASVAAGGGGSDASTDTGGGGDGSIGGDAGADADAATVVWQMPSKPSVDVGTPTGSWTPLSKNLKTKWAADVTPENVHADYPRPQLWRNDWANLNGLWDYAIRPKADGQPTAWTGKILVPFPVESQLSGVGKPLTPSDRLWYRRTFTVPAAWKGQRLIVHFGAVDSEADVLVNGTSVLQHKGGYEAFSADITSAVKGTGLEEIVVSVLDATNQGIHPFGKQTLTPGGINYTASSGIWQSVWLEPVPSVHVDSLLLVPNTDKGEIAITPKVIGQLSAAALSVTVYDGGKVVAKTRSNLAASGTAVNVVVPSPKLWSPEAPNLYDLRIDLENDGAVVDTVGSYAGLRKVEIVKNAGITQIGLNGASYFLMGPLDQGFWPDGLYTAPTDAALRYDIEMTKQLGFNVTRKHIKVEPDRWYYWCDKLGLAVWQDTPNGTNGTAEAKAAFEAEMAAMIEGHKSWTSILIWTVFNEGWGQYDTPRVTAAAMALDSTRLFDDASGWTDANVGNLIDMHVYPDPGSPTPEASRAAVNGEFGGVSMDVADHMWTGNQQVYTQVKTGAELAEMYLSFRQAIAEYRKSPGLSGAIYTQITDVEGELNGFLTYDRAVIKAPVDSILKANLLQFPTYTVVAPTSEANPGVTWRYTTAAPATGWQTAAFDDSGWSQGPGGFGDGGAPNGFVRTTWNTSDIWIRRAFNITGAVPSNITVRIHHDEDAEVYVNGTLAHSATGYSTAYRNRDLPLAVSALKTGNNTIAVHCKQTIGGQYIDVGLLSKQ